MVSTEVLIGLLTAAALAAAATWYLRGWWLKRKNLRLRQAFYLGIAELLQDETDQALDIFLQISRQHAQMVELQLMLASLFRQRGEVDKAIRIHQSLLERPDLSPALKREVQAGLGQDFMKAGVFDRAEQHFLALESRGELPPQALKSLIKIYEMEQDWPKAIRYAMQLERQTGKRLSDVVAHYYCELAEIALRKQDFSQAQERVTQALAKYPGSARARMMEARLHQQREELSRALTAWKLALETRPDLLGEIWPELESCYLAVHGAEQLLQELDALLEPAPSALAQIIRAQVLARDSGEEVALKRLETDLQRVPTITGLACWLSMKTDLGGGGEMESIRLIVQALRAGKRPWHCNQCGFSGSSFHWQCPGCKSWGSIHFSQEKSSDA